MKSANPCKQAQELLFSRKVSSKLYASLHFNDNFIHQVQFQKHIGLFLDSKLSFAEQIQWIVNKTCRRTGLVRKLQKIILRAALLKI